MHNIKSRCYRTGKCTVCRCVHTLSQPGNFTGWGSEGVNTGSECTSLATELWTPFAAKWTVMDLSGQKTLMSKPTRSSCPVTWWFWRAGQPGGDHWWSAKRKSPGQGNVSMISACGSSLCIICCCCFQRKILTFVLLIGNKRQLHVNLLSSDFVLFCLFRLQFHIARFSVRGVPLGLPVVMYTQVAL